jgi:hypothetical protein
MGPSTGTSIESFMNEHPKTLEQKFNTAAKIVAISFYISFFSSAALGLTFEYLETRWEWLRGWRWFFEISSRALITYAFSALVINLMIPGPLILIFPALGYAWLRGGIRHFYSYTPWREVSDFDAFLHLLGAMLSFAFGIMLLHTLILNGWYGQALASFVKGAN